MLTLRMPRISPGRRPAASAAASIRHRTAGISPVGMEPSERGDPAVGEPGGDSERARPEGPQPHRDRAAGLGFHVEVADAVVAPVLGVAGVCPGAVDDLNGFCEAIEGSGVSQLRKGCWQIRKMFIPVIMTSQLRAKVVASRRLTWAPITSRRQVSSTSGCLFLYARPGRQRKELNNFRFAFPQVRTRSERQQEAQEALRGPRPFLLPSFA